MNNNIFNEAIETHVQWKLILKRHLEEGVIDDLEYVGNFHACNLGKWIYSDGIKYNILPSFDSMCTAHEQFHRAAAEVAFHSKAKNIEKATSLMAIDGGFSQASVNLMKALMDCSKDLSDSLVKGIRNIRKVKNILSKKETKNIFSIEGSSTVMEAVKMMIDHNIGSVVINQDAEFIGILTERGYLKNLLHKGISTWEMPVSKMVDADTTYIDAEDSVEQCMLVMLSTHTRHLPVLENGKLIGVISIDDVIKEVVEDDSEKFTDLDAYVHNRYGAQV